MDTIDETLKQLGAQISELEAWRKRDPREFFSAPGNKKLPDGPGYKTVMSVMGGLEGFVSRLKAIQ